MSEDNKTAQTMWNLSVGEVKDTNTYNCLVILLTWVNEILRRLDDIEAKLE